MQGEGNSSPEGFSVPTKPVRFEYATDERTDREGKPGGHVAAAAASHRLASDPVELIAELRRVIQRQERRIRALEGRLETH